MLVLRILVLEMVVRWQSSPTNKINHLPTHSLHSILRSHAPTYCALLLLATTSFSTKRSCSPQFAPHFLPPSHQPSTTPGRSLSPIPVWLFWGVVVEGPGRHARERACNLRMYSVLVVIIAGQLFQFALNASW